MIEIIIAVLGLTLVAGIWDLKTTEVPDEIPAIMIILGIFYWIINYSISGNIIPLLASLIMGTLLLAIGLLLYKKGQWGGADAWILAAIGYTIPFYQGELFIFPFIFNFFMVSAVYMIIYASVLGIKNKKVFNLYYADLLNNKKILLLPLAFLVLMSALFYMLPSRMGFTPIVETFFVLLFLTLFWRYAKIIEKYLFKKKIPVSKLRAGDVLEEMNWVGLTPRQVARMKRSRKYVTIKEGVRFVPVFFLALLITFLLGNLLFRFFGA